MAAEAPQGGGHGKAGGDAVVDDHDHLLGRQVVGRQAQAAGQFVVHDQHAAGGDGGQGQFGVEGRADLAGDDDVQGPAEGFGDRARDHDAAAGDAQDGAGPAARCANYSPRQGLTE